MFISKDDASTIQALVTSAAILVGGGWALAKFGWRRERYPKAILQHTALITRLDEQRFFCRIDLTINNCGSKLICLESILSRIQQIEPLPNTGDGIFEPDPTSAAPEIEWPALQTRDHSFGNGERQIEPGESDTLQFDYILPVGVNTIQAYSYVSNRTTKRKGHRLYFDKIPREIGWNVTTIHKLAPTASETPSTDKNE